MELLTDLFIEAILEVLGMMFLVVVIIYVCIYLVRNLLDD